MDLLDALDELPEDAMVAAPSRLDSVAGGTGVGAHSDGVAGKPPSYTRAAAATAADVGRAVDAADAAGAGPAAGATARDAPMLVLDFDLTLSSVHVWNTLAKSGSRRIDADRIPGDLPVSAIYGGEERLEMLRDFLSQVHGTGARVVVLTNNHRAVVDRCLRCADLSDLVAGVIGREMPGTKGQIVAALMSRRRCCPRWVFADDDVVNVRSVEAATRGACLTLCVGGTAGMQRRHLDQLRGLLDDGAPPPPPAACTAVPAA